MKKGSIAAAGCLAAVLLACMLLGRYVIGDRPLRSLTAEEIASIEVRLLPPDRTVRLTAEQVEALLPLLCDVVAFQRDDSGNVYDGQVVNFTFSKQEVTQTNVMAYAPFIVLDGVGRRCRYGPCEALNQFANDLIR